MIICLGTTPAVQRAMIFKSLSINGVSRAVEVLEAAAGKSVNAAKVAARLGEKVMATGFVGGNRGEFLRRELDAAGIAHDFVTVGPETRLCVTVIDRGGRTHTELVEESKTVEEPAWDELREKLRRMLEGAKMLVLSGTLTPGGPGDFYGECARLARQRGVRVIVDAQGAALMQSLPARPSVVKPNRAELANSLGMKLDSEAAVCQGIRRLMELGAESAVVTMGAEGAIAGDGRGFWRIVTPAVEAVNSIGSGDAFAAGLAAGLVRGEALPEACRLGAACGAANALTLLAGQVELEDVNRLLDQIHVEARQL